MPGAFGVMSTTTKVFLSAGLGSFVASWVTPKIVPKLPAQLQTGAAAQATHAVIAGLSAAATYYGLAKLGVAA